LAFAAVAAEGEFLATGNATADGGQEWAAERITFPSADLGPAPAPLPAVPAAEAYREAGADPMADPSALSDTAKGRLLAVDALFGSTDPGDSWEPLSGELLGQQCEDNLGVMSPWLL